MNISTHSVSLSWMIQGNAAITNIFVSYVTEDNFRTFARENTSLSGGAPSAPPTEASISGLEPNTLYSFSVTTESNFGTSDPVTVDELTLPLG